MVLIGVALMQKRRFLAMKNKSHPSESLNKKIVKFKIRQLKHLANENLSDFQVPAHNSSSSIKVCS